MQTQVQARYTKKMTLYNMLQDFRHVLVVDYREEFDELFIRDSYKWQSGQSLGQLIGLLAKVEKINVEKETKYKTKRIRRVVLIAAEKLSLDDERVKQWEQLLRSDVEYKDYKLLVLENSFMEFANKYPFLCHSRELSKLNEGKYAEDIRSRMVNMKENDKAVLYSFAKFPTEIIEDKLFVGSIYNSNSQLQLKDLKIKSLIDLAAYNEDEIVPAWKHTNYSYQHIPLTAEMGIGINFDEINRMIDQLNTEGKTPILIYCKVPSQVMQNGESLAPGFAIAYLMYKAKLDVNVASLKVFQATSSVEIAKWLYTELLLYKPNPPPAAAKP